MKIVTSFNPVTSSNCCKKNRNSNLAKITISILVDFDKKSRFSISILRSSQHYCHQSLKSLLHCTLPADCSKTSPQRVWLSGTLSRWLDDFHTNLPYKLDNPRVNAATYP